MSRSRGRHAFLVTAICLVILAIFVWSFQRWQGKRDAAQHKMLQRRALSSRPSEGRFTGNPTYSPYIFYVYADIRKAVPKLDILSRDFHRGGSSRKLSVEESKEKALAAISGGDILGGLSSLQDAAQRAPTNAKIQSDLAAAYLAFGPHDPAAYLRGAALATKAVQIDGSLAEAIFNQAIAFERLYLRSDAEMAWEKYLSIDSSSEWANEARIRRERLRELRGQAREAQKLEDMRGDDIKSGIDEFGANAVLVHALRYRFSAYADTFKASLYKDANIKLGDIADIAGALAEVAGDETLLKEVELLEKYEAGCHACGDLNSLLRGYQLLGEGLSLYEGSQFREAMPLFLEAHAKLAAGGSMLSKWANLYRGICGYQDSAYEQALNLFGKQLPTIDERREPIIAARLHWMKGLLLTIQGNFTDGLRDYTAALHYLERVKDKEDVAAVLVRIGGIHSQLGDHSLAWRYQYKALSAAVDSRKPERLQYTLEEVVDTLQKMEEERIAFLFQKKILAVARSSGNRMLIASALKGMAVAQMRSARFNAAAMSISESIDIAESIEDPGVRSVVTGDILLVSGVLMARSDPRAAVRTLSDALLLAQSTKFHFQIAQIYTELARVHLKLNDFSLAESSYKKAIEERERQRAAVEDSRRRVFFDQVRTLFDEMILFQVKARGDIAQGFNYLERSRARWLLDQERRHGLSADVKDMIKPLTLSEIFPEIPHDVAFIVFREIEDKLFTWVVLPREASMYEASATVTELHALVSDLRAGIENGLSQDGLSEPSCRLHTDLIKPFRLLLNNSKRLIIVPDRFLYSLPFSALKDCDTGRFLIEDFTISIAPSVTTAFSFSSVGSISYREKVLLIGNESADVKVFPHLSPLANVRAELEQIAAKWPSDLLKNEEATKKAFVSSLGRYSVVHFAGHAVLNDNEPLNSVLVLSSGEAADSGLLSSEEILEHASYGTKLVVLSACETASGKPSDSEGLIGLVYPFLASGVPSVVGSLWQIDDRFTPAFMKVFYDSLLNEGRPAEALRSAQLQFLRSTDEKLSRPVIWAAFVAAGGV